MYAAGLNMVSIGDYFCIPVTFVRRIHYNDVLMGAIASQITSLTIVYSTVYSSVDQRKHQSSASLAFVRGIHRGPVNSPYKWPVTRKMFPFDDVIMSLTEAADEATSAQSIGPLARDVELEIFLCCHYGRVKKALDEHVKENNFPVTTCDSSEKTWRVNTAVERLWSEPSGRTRGQEWVRSKCKVRYLTWSVAKVNGVVEVSGPPLHWAIPTDTWRNNNVIITSKRHRFDVIMTLLLRRVSTGM